jgi:hypothetical protein
MADSLVSLRRLREARQTRTEERCELCGTPIAAQHRHLFEPATRALVCACQACSLLFSDGDPSRRYRMVPPEVSYVPEFKLADEQWDELLVPVNLAFFVVSSTAGRPLALYPSPAGATESQLGLDSWDSLVAENPLLGHLRTDVQALLVNRVGSVRDHFIVPIDECFHLVGLVRAHWKGLSGGPEVWGQIAEFFADLRSRARVVGNA